MRTATFALPMLIALACGAEDYPAPPHLGSGGISSQGGAAQGAGGGALPAGGILGMAGVGAGNTALGGGSMGGNAAFGGASMTGGALLGGSVSAGGMSPRGGSSSAADGGRNGTGGAIVAGAGGTTTIFGGRSGLGGAAGNAGRAGASGGAGIAGAGGASASGCSAGKYIICEDFEATAVGSTPVGWTRHGTQVSVSDDAAKRGSHSLKLGPVAAAERRLYRDAAPLGSAHWGRIFYKVQQPVPDAFVHSTIVSFSGTAPQRGSAEFRVIDTVKQAVDTPDVASLHQYLYNVQVIGGSEFSRQGPYDQKFENVWHCVEYHIDGGDQSYALYIDGKEEIAFRDGVGNYSKSDIPMSFKELRVGWINYQQAPPGFTAWIDEIAFDDQRIGCE